MVAFTTRLTRFRLHGEHATLEGWLESSPRSTSFINLRCLHCGEVTSKTTLKNFVGNGRASAMCACKPKAGCRAPLLSTRTKIKRLLDAHGVFDLECSEEVRAQRQACEFVPTCARLPTGLAENNRRRRGFVLALSRQRLRAPLQDAHRTAQQPEFWRGLLCVRGEVYESLPR